MGRSQRYCTLLYLRRTGGMGLGGIGVSAVFGSWSCKREACGMVVGEGLSKSGPNLPMFLVSLLYIFEMSGIWMLMWGLSWRGISFVEARSTHEISSVQIRLRGDTNS